MEVTPELYAWLTSMNIIDCVKSLRSQENAFQIPQKTINALMGGKYMDKILLSLEDSYNKFYKLKLNYTANLVNIKPIDENDEYISNSVKYFNWNLINESLAHFGLNYTSENIEAITSGDTKMLLEVITKIFTLSNELLKRSSDLKELNPIQSSTSKVNLASNVNTNTNGNETTSQITTSFPTERNGDKDTINLNTLNPKKNYEICSSPLELFIISLCRNFELKPRQAVALLSNNRKYLSLLCNKGIKGSYAQIENWLHDLNVNIKSIIKVLKNSPNGLNIALATIGSALCSKKGSISLTTAELMSQIQIEFGFDWDWLVDEGVDAFMFAITKHDTERLNLLNILYEFVRNRLSDYILELRKKVKLEKSKEKVMSFISCIVPYITKLNKLFYQEIYTFICDTCLNETDDKSLAISIMSDVWLYCVEKDEDDMKRAILNYLKTNARMSTNNVAMTAIGKMFYLMQKFGEGKNDNAPPLYKVLVFLLLESYDDEVKREFYLVNFEKFFTKNQIVPIDILLEPYFKQVKNCRNYALCDLIFIFKMIEHPRLTGYNLLDVLEFILGVTINNLSLSRTANLILSLIFEKKIIFNFIEIKNDICQIFGEYIKTVLNLFVSNLQNLEDRAILETAYDILSENISVVNSEVHDSVVDAVNKYRKMKKQNSICLLAMLWIYDDHDDILLKLEEDNRIIYEPVEKMLEKQKKEQEEKDRKNFTKKAQTLLEKINSKKKNLEMEKENKEKEKFQRDQQIKKSLSKKRQRKSIMLGIGIEEKFAKSPLLIQNMVKTSSTSSSMNTAINNAEQTLTKKSKISLTTSNIVKPPLVPLTSPNIQKDDIYQRYGNIMSIDKKKALEEYKEAIKAKEKLISSQQLILPEKTIIKTDRKTGTMSDASRAARKNYITSEIYKNFILPINLEEEEDRETKAIEGYNAQYSKNMKLYFRTYSNEVTNTISKSNLLKMLREKGYNKNEINLEELTIAIRNLFGDNLNNLTYEQFSSLLVQLAFLIYTKKRDTLTISECYGNLLRHFMPKHITEATIKLNKRLKPVVDLIKQKLTNPKDENDSYFNMPPGFKILNKISVVYNCRLAPHFLEFLGEAKFVCYELIEEILFNILNSSTLEPYVKVNKYSDVVLEPGVVKNWSNAVTIAYVNLDDQYEKSGIEVADCLEDGLRRLCKGKDKMGNEIIPPLIKYEIEESRKYMESENAKEERRIQRKKEIKKKVEEFRKLKEERRKMRIKEENEKRKEMRKKIEKEKEETKTKVEEVKERRNKLEEEKKNKLIEKQEKAKEESEKKYQERKKFFNMQQRRLREQFKHIKHQKELIQKESNDTVLKLPNCNASYLKRDKDYIAFEKNLNTTIRDLRNRSDIKGVFDKYSQHLKIIYEIYSRIGYNKISFFSNESIHINEFKEFLINFTVLGLLISSEQMIFIFNKIAGETRGEKDDQMYLTYDEFELSLIFLSIFSKFSTKTRKILPSDVDNATPEIIENFLKFLGLKTPFNRNEMEMFINDRRAMTMKKLIKLQREIKKEKIKEYKQQQFEKDIGKQRENKKQEMLDERENKITNKEENSKNEENTKIEGEDNKKEEIKDETKDEGNKSNNTSQLKVFEQTKTDKSKEKDKDRGKAPNKSKPSTSSLKTPSKK